MDTKPTIKNSLIAILPLILVVFVIFFLIMPQIREKNNQVSVTNFEECVAVGNPVMESYPRQCRYDEQTFTEDLGQIVGGDKDEHGCVGSAGYSWCEPKSKCLRIWEEPCYENLGQEIQYLLAAKYNKPAGQVNVTIAKQTDAHAAGSVLFGTGGPGEGGMFLAAKIDELWQVVFDGNGSVDCGKMREEYNFSDEILKPNFCD